MNYFHRIFTLTICTSICFALAGCAGYRIGPIKPTTMLEINSIAVPTFKNDTLIPRIEVLVANTLIKQFQQDGTYRIASSEKADAILEGTISQITRRSARSARGNVLQSKEFEMVLTITYKLTNRATGKPIETRTAAGRTSFFVSGDIQQDERQAIPLAAEEASVHLVSQLSEGW